MSTSERTSARIAGWALELIVALVIAAIAGGVYLVGQWIGFF